MEEREELERAVNRLEAQRDSLGDAAVEAALEGLRQKLAELFEPESVAAREATASKTDAERRVVTILSAMSQARWPWQKGWTRKRGPRS